MNKSRGKQPQDSAPFDRIDEDLESEAQKYLSEVSDVLWPLMEGVQLDAKKRRFVWPDSKRLSFDQAVKHVSEKCDCSAADIAGFLISWIENYAPEDATEKQLEELDRYADAWVDKLEERDG